jgi:hypothetical protein
MSTQPADRPVAFKLDITAAGVNVATLVVDNRSHHERSDHSPSDHQRVNQQVDGHFVVGDECRLRTVWIDGHTVRVNGTDSRLVRQFVLVKEGTG